MVPEREVLISALKMTRKGCTRIEEISRDASVPSTLARKILEKYSKVELANISEETVVMDGEQRLGIAYRSIELGADLERVCRLLRWREFEDISALAFEARGFSVMKHFRFKDLDKRWEIDILALKNPFVLSVDCKHWRKSLRRSALSRIVESQVKRTQALYKVSPQLHARSDIAGWRSAMFIPLILSLIPSPTKFHQNVPIVPVFQLRNFITEMPAHADHLTRFPRKFS
ncbi:MAG: restriction endonuclease [Candidatus Bathyarchaeota archaeon]|nr:restriction endonuclease [Candidatus Bathyarchaeota archaeon]MDH5687462.1 restriction endonuclease [Candidatus Bathyarchaeota archaeon]